MHSVAGWPDPTLADVRQRALIRKAVLFSVPPVRRLVEERDRLREENALDGFGPGHPHSPIPDWATLTPEGAVPDSCAAIDLNLRGQLELLRTLAKFHGEHSFADDPQPGFRYFFRNGFYAAPDGIVLYCMLRHLAPRRVIEVGSGFSSALILDTVDDDTRLTFIEPDPTRLRDLLWPDDRPTILETPLQETPLSQFTELSAGDILFVDSSHVTKRGSDVNVLLFEILPSLQSGVYVHFHDIFWPFEYPAAFAALRWAVNEAYIVRAFLEYNTEFEIALFPSYLEHALPEELAGALPLALTHPPLWPTFCGSTLWLRRL
jgi:Methyltransferase domain